MPDALLDTGPLVAYLYPRDAYHDWAVGQLETAELPFRTCEAVVTEACFLVARNGQPAARVLTMLARGVLRIDLDLEQELKAVQTLMERYGNVPMSLADACLVRMAEITGLPVCTLDSDFEVYRMHGRHPIKVISPRGAHGLHEP